MTYSIRRPMLTCPKCRRLGGIVGQSDIRDSWICENCRVPLHDSDLFTSTTTIVPLTTDPTAANQISATSMWNTQFYQNLVATNQLFTSMMGWTQQKGLPSGPDRRDNQRSDDPRSRHDTGFSPVLLAGYPKPRASQRTWKEGTSTGVRLTVKNRKKLKEELYPSGFPLERAIRTEPYVGWKYAALMMSGRGFYSLNGVAYGMEEVAKHIRLPGYAIQQWAGLAPGPTEYSTAPVDCGKFMQPDCSCGFWAYDHPGRGSGSGDCLLRVELYGKVLVGQYGYRAEKQRVMAIYPLGICRYPSDAIRHIYQVDVLDDYRTPQSDGPW